MQNIFLGALPIFLITLLGSLIKRKWLTSEEFWRGLEKLSYFILFPAVLFNYIHKADLTSNDLIRLVFALTIATVSVTVLLVIYRRKIPVDSVKFTSIFQGAIRYNSYIFFGLGGSLFGSEGLAVIAVISSYMIIFTNVISVMVFAYYIPRQEQINSRQNFTFTCKMILSNPLIIASVVGFIFNYGGFELNIGIKKTIAALSESALAIGMLNVGAGLKFNLCMDDVRHSMIASFFKLVIFPIITAFILSLMSITGIDKSIGLLYSCLPCASTAYVLSRQLGGDPDLMASIITFTTIFSVFSISFLMYLLG